MNRKHALASPQQSQLYNAYAALGFKCSDCGATKNLMALHKQGKQAHRKLYEQLGASWSYLVATNAEIRSFYRLVCGACYRSKHARYCMAKQAQEKSSSRELD